MRVGPSIWIAAFVLALVPARLLSGLACKCLALSPDEKALARLQSPPLGLPRLPHTQDNLPTVEKISLGRKLFFDRRLSFNQTMSCGMCHVPEQGFTSQELATPIGVEGRSLRRNAPTILNAAYSSRLFHDGRGSSLETQALDPILAREEMAAPSAGWVLEKIKSLPDYTGLFEQAFAKGPTLDTVGQAIATWERTLLASNSCFDRWFYGGQQDALSEQQKHGFELFSTKANCVKCHIIGAQSALFTDQLFHNTGIALRQQLFEQGAAKVAVEISPDQVVFMDRKSVESVGIKRPADLGRSEVTLKPSDLWKFRTPSLRNVAVTAPYMHDGSLRSLQEVVSYYDQGATPHPELDSLVEPLHLRDAEQKALVAFLESLTSLDLPELIQDARRIH